MNLRGLKNTPLKYFEKNLFTKPYESVIIEPTKH